METLIPNTGSDAFITGDTSHVNIDTLLKNIESQVELSLSQLSKGDYSNEGLIQGELHKLESIPRFQGLNTNIEITDSVLAHTKRLITIVENNRETLKALFDVDYLLKIIVIHDIPEVATSDIPTPVKDIMSDEQRTKLQGFENLYYKKIGVTGDVINDMQSKNSNEAMFMKLIDLIDGIYFYYFELYQKEKNKIGDNLAPLERYLNSEKDIDYYFSELKKRGIQLYPIRGLHGTLLDKFSINRINDLYFKHDYGRNNFLSGVSFKVFGFEKKCRQQYMNLTVEAEEITLEHMNNLLNKKRTD